MDHFRDLSRAIALGDCLAAAEILDLIVRDEVLSDLDDGASARAGEEIELGRSDAAIIRRRKAA